MLQHWGIILGAMLVPQQGLSLAQDEDRSFPLTSRQENKQPLCKGWHLTAWQRAVTHLGANLPLLGQGGKRKKRKERRDEGENQYCLKGFLSCFYSSFQNLDNKNTD